MNFGETLIFNTYKNNTGSLLTLNKSSGAVVATIFMDSKNVECTPLIMKQSLPVFLIKKSVMKIPKKIIL